MRNGESCISPHTPDPLKMEGEKCILKKTKSVWNKSDKMHFHNFKEVLSSGKEARSQSKI